MKKICLIIFLIIARGAFSQPDITHFGWKHSLVAALNLTQVSYRDWASAGVNPLAFGALVAGQSAEDELKTNWTTGYKFAFGETKLDDKEIRKTDDIIDILSVLTYKTGVYVNPFASIQFTTQFTTGYKYAEDSADTRTAV